MTTFVLIPGAGGNAWYWHLLVADAGHDRAMAEQSARDGTPASLETAADLEAVFFNDVPPDITAQAMEGGCDQSGAPFVKPWPLDGWPDVPTKFLLCRDDRFLPADFMRRVVRERLGITPEEIEGGHLVALSRPKELADRLEKYLAEVGGR